jgi:adenosylcobinamide-phosphate synthase
MIDMVAAVVLDWAIGDPYWFPHPVIYIGEIIKMLENFFRSKFKSKRDLRIAGGIIVIVVATISFFLPFGILKLVEKISWLHHIINILILWTTLAARCLHKEGIKVYDVLKVKDIAEARIKLSYIVGRDTNELSEKEIIRADVETIAENTSDGIIAPMFFAFIGGAPLAMLYKAINTMDSMLGYMNEKYRYIGYFPAKTDDVFNYIPARLTAIFICMAAPLTSGSVIGSFKIMLRDRKNHKSPNCGYPEAAAAGAMGIQIGGTNSYFGEIMYKPTIGDRTKELMDYHIKDCIKLMYAAEVLMLLLFLIKMRY